MASLIEVGVTNAIFASILACMAYSASRLCRRPAVSHVLWVLVLVKLVTPPLVTFPIGIELAPVTLPGLTNADEVSAWLAASSDSAADLTAITAVDEAHSADDAAAGETIGATPIAPGSWTVQVLLVAILVWVLGAVVWFLGQVVRIVRFLHLLKSSKLAPGPLQRQARALGREMDLTSCPDVWIVADSISPMLWAFGGRAKLLFPQELLDRVSYQSRSTLLAHELAHYRRGDHWVRVLEFVVTGLFWWHPVTWWARHEIEAAEEQCCDAWVVSQFPNLPRCYAEALLDTIDFLSERPRYRVPAATGIGEVPLLRKRLTQIMLGVDTPHVPWRYQLTIAIAAVLLVPVNPALFAKLASPSATVMVAPTETRDRHSRRAVSEVAERDSTSTRDVWATAMSPDGRYSVIATAGQGVFLHDTLDEQTVDLSRYGVSSAAFSPDGRLLATGGSKGAVQLWSVASGRMLVTFTGHRGEVRSVVFSPDGSRLISGSRDGAVEVWNVHDRRHLASLPLRRSRTDCVRISPDGRQVAVASGSWRSSEPGRVTFWDSVTLELLGHLECGSAVGAVTFDGNSRLLTAQRNGRVTLWDTSSRQALNSGWIDKEVVVAARFSPDSTNGLYAGSVTWDRLDETVGQFTTGLLRMVERAVGQL